MCSSQTLTDGICPVNKGIATYDRRIHKYNVDIKSHFTQQSSITKFNEATTMWIYSYFSCGMINVSGLLYRNDFRKGSVLLLDE